MIQTRARLKSRARVKPAELDLSTIQSHGKGDCKMPHYRLVAPIFASGALLLAGCGSVGKPSSPSVQTSAARIAENGTGFTTAGSVPLPRPEGKPLTRAQLIRQANEICERVNKRRATVDFGTQASIAAYMPALAAFEHGAADELARLRPPAGLRADYRRIVRGAEVLASESARYGEYARTGNLAGEGRLLHSAGLAQTKMARIARRHRLRACSDL